MKCELDGSKLVIESESKEEYDFLMEHWDKTDKAGERFLFKSTKWARSGALRTMAFGPSVKFTLELVEPA